MSAATGTAAGLSSLARDVVNRYQDGFPLAARPFAVMGEELGTSEQAVLAAVHELREAGALSRVGTVVRTGTVGASTLAAMCVTPDRLESVAECVGAFSEVNHSYEREGTLNLWFVVVAPSDDRLRAVLAEIDRATGISVVSLPMESAYHIDLGFRI